MLPVGWQDRKSHKQTLSNWLNTDDSFFAISVNDSQELDDIESWLRGEFVDGLVGHVTFSSDTEILKFALLETLVFSLGDENFDEFIKNTSITPTLHPVKISQSMGDGVKAKGEVEYENNVQKVSVYVDSNLVQKQYYFEQNIFPLLAAFKKDLEKILKKKKILFVIKFQKLGFEDKNMGSDFLVWFQEHFLYRMSQIKNVKVCIIFQGNIDRLTKINEGQKMHLKELNHGDILEATNGYFANHEEFCNGVIDPDSNSVEYKVFKRRFHVRMQKLIQEQQNG